MPALSRGRPRFRWRTLAAALAVAAAVGGCATLDAFQRRAIFQHEAAGRYTVEPPPAGAQVFDLPVAGTERVRAWYLDAGSDAPAVLFLHGARRALGGHVPRLERLHALGVSVLAIEYRGFGDSSPRLPSEDSVIEDGRAALAELARRQPDPARRSVYGYSLGGAVAIALAAEPQAAPRPGDAPGPAAAGFSALVLESTFTRIADLVRGSNWGSVPGVSLLVTQRFDSLARMPEVRQPVLLIHGTADRLVPVAMADALADAARAAPRVRLVKVDGAGHRSAVSLAGAALDAELRAFLVPGAPAR